MKHSFVGIGAIGVLALAAGVVVAGLPSSPPATTFRIENIPVTSTTTTLVVVTADTEAPEPAVATTPPETIAPDEPVTSDTVTVPPADRSDLVVVAVNAGSGPGSATAMAERLRGLGYARAVPLDADRGADVSHVYYRAGLIAEARRLVADLELSGVDVVRLSKATAFRADRQVDLAVLLGRDGR